MNDAGGRATLDARLGSGIDATLERFDGKMLELRTSRAHAPGERVEVTVEASGRALVARGKVVRVHRAADLFSVTLSLQSLARDDREALASLFDPPRVGGDGAASPPSGT